MTVSVHPRDDDEREGHFRLANELCAKEGERSEGQREEENRVGDEANDVRGEDRPVPATFLERRVDEEVGHLAHEEGCATGERELRRDEGRCASADEDRHDGPAPTELVLDQIPESEGE